MDLVITLTTAGNDTGPFNIYSNVDGFTNAFESNVLKAVLLSGFPTANVPLGTTEIRVQSVNDLCNNYGAASIVPLEFYFAPKVDSYVTHFLEDGTFAYVYGYFNSYFNGYYSVPGNLLVKLNPDRTVDTSFNIEEGFNFSLVYEGAVIYKQPDGKIILSGFYSTFNGNPAKSIIRLNTDGSRDNTFNSGSGFNNYTTKISKDSFGNLYVIGKFETYDGNVALRIVKLLADGSRDNTFDPGSSFDNVPIDILHNVDDTFYVTGYFTKYNGVSASKIIKLNPNGTVDNSFNSGTGFVVGTNRTIKLGRIEGESSFFAGGMFTKYNGIDYKGLIKLNPDGSVITSFNDGNLGFNGSMSTLRIIWTNKILCIPADSNYGPFTKYNDTLTYDSPIILNADGSILKTWNIGYYNIYIIGYKVFGQPVGGENQIIYTYVP